MYILLSKTKNPPSLKLWRTQKGFTFIEVIIIFTIIFIMTAVLLSTSYKDRERKELQATAREVTASIREAQNNALTGKQKGTGTMPCAFQYEISSDGYQIKHKTRPLDVHLCDNNFKDFFDFVPLPLGVTMAASKRYSNDPTPWSSVSSIEFDVPYGKITAEGSSEYDGIEIALEKNGKYYHLCLYPTGMIEDLGIHLADQENEVCPF